MATYAGVFHFWISDVKTVRFFSKTGDLFVKIGFLPVTVLRDSDVTSHV